MRFTKKTLLAGATLLLAAATPLAKANIITTATSIVGAGTDDIRDGNGGNGYFVMSGSLTISNLTLTNYTAKGGEGSGGGAGMGGAIFVNEGASVVLHNVSFFGNQAIGGDVNVDMTVGGSLNGLFQSGIGAAGGLDGGTPAAQHYIDPNGTNGTNGGRGTTASAGFGGRGGNGGDGGNGDAANGAAPYVLDITSQSLAVTAKAASILGASQPFAASEIPGLILEATQIALDLSHSVAALVLYDKAIQSGQIGVGGDGGNGGNAGHSGFGYGGVSGGAGGDGGAGTTERSGSAYKGGAAGGAGGDGGNGGIGGFGAGGGAGGDGGRGGEGARIGASPGQAAIAAEIQIIETPAVYERGYMWDHDNDGVADKWVQLEAHLSEAPDTELQVSVTPPGAAAPVLVDIIGRETSAATRTELVITPGQEAVAATTAGKRPDGADGAGGAGGIGGFGGGDGTGGMDASGLREGGTGGHGMGGAIFVRADGSLTVMGNSTFGGNDSLGGNGVGDSETLSEGASGSGFGTDMFIMAGAEVILDAGAGNTIVFNGTIADDSAASGIGGSIATGQGAGVSIVSGTTVFNGRNTYTGVTDISGGVLQAIDGFGVHAQSHIHLDDGGIFQSNGTFTRRIGGAANQVSMGTSGGFAAKGGNLFVTLNNGAKLTWGANNFVNGSLNFGSDSADSVVVFTNALDLDGYNAKIYVTDNTGSTGDYALLTGVISNGALTVGSADHTGALVLNGVNTYAGGTTVNGGTLALGADGYLSATGALVVNHGAFDISLAGDRTVGSLSGLGGGVALGSHTLTVNQSVDGTYAGVIADGGVNGGSFGALVKQGAQALTFTAAQTYTGATSVKAGALVLSGSGALASKSVTVDAGASLVNNTAGLHADTVLTVNGVAAFNTLAETISVLNGSGSVQLAAGLTVSSGDFSGVISGVGSLTKIGSGLLLLSGNNTGTGVVQIDAGTLSLTGTLATLTVNVASGATLDNVNGGLATGATLTNAGFVVLGADNTITAYVSNAGVLNGAGKTLTAATYALNDGSITNANLGSGIVTANGAVAINGTSDASVHDIVTGTTTLGAAERLVDTTTVAVSSGATLALGGNETIRVLNGAGTVDTVAAANVFTVSSGNFSGDITGAGALTKVSADTLTLSGANTFTGAFNIDAGLVTLTGSVATLTVNVASGATLDNVNGGLVDGATLTNAGVVILGVDELIAAYVSNAGVLNGAGKTLTAATYALNDGSITNANLGTGIVTANGLVAINGTSDASVHNIVTGTTTLGAAERLVDTTTVDVSADAKLVLGGSETITTLNGAGTVDTVGAANVFTVSNGLFSGDITGLGALTKVSADTLTLSGANTFAGAFNLNAGVVNLDGSLATLLVNVASGTTLNVSNGGLAAGTVATVDGRLAITGVADVINTLFGSGVVALGADLTVSSGNFSGVIEGASAFNKVSAGALTLSGVSTHTGALNVDAGTLTLTGSIDSSSLNVASGATFDNVNGGLADNVAAHVDGTFTNRAAETLGALTGSGLVNVNGLLNVASGNFSGNLAGAADLNKIGAGTLTLTGVSAHTGVFNVQSGKAVLTGTLLSSVINVASGATFATGSGLASTASLNNDGTVDIGSANVLVGSFSNSGVLDGTGKLTAGVYTLTGGNINANLGTGVVNVTGDVLLAGTSDASEINIALGAVLKLASAERLIDSVTVNLDGELSLLGGDETIRVLNGTGTIRAGVHSLVVTHGGDFTGNLIVDAGDFISQGNLTLSGDSDLGDGTATIENNSTLTIATGGSLTSNVIFVAGGSTLQSHASSALNYGLLHGSGELHFGGVFINLADVKGTLTFNGDFENRSYFATGNSPGVTNITGNYTESGLVEMEIGGLAGAGVTPNGFDQVRVGGNVQFNSTGSMVIQGYNGYVPERGQEIQLVADLAGNARRVNGALGSVLFDLDGLAGPGAAVNNAAVVFDLATGRAVMTGLNADDSTYADLGTDDASRAVAASLFGGAQVATNQIDSDTYEGRFALQMLQSTDLTGSLSTFAPTGYASLLDYSRSVDSVLNRLVLDRVSTFGQTAGLKHRDGGAYAGAITNDVSSSATGSRYRRTDYYAGLDFVTNSPFILGAVFWGNDGHIHHNFGKSEAYGFGGSLYTRYNVTERLSFFGTAGYSSYDFKTKRRTYNGEVNAKPTSDDISLVVGGQYVAWNNESFSVAPQLSVAYSNTTTYGFTEHDADDALHIGSFTSNRAAARAGVSGMWNTKVLERAFNLELSMAVDQVIANNTNDLPVRLVNAGAVSYRIGLPDEAKTTFVYGVNVGYNVYGPASIYLGYQGRVNEDGDQYGFNAGVRVRF